MKGFYMWMVKDKLGYRIIISQNILDNIQGLCYNRGNTKANERLCMTIEVKQIKSEYPLGTEDGISYHIYPSEER